MTECRSIGGETHILENKKELEDFVKDKGLNDPRRNKGGGKTKGI